MHRFALIVNRNGACMALFAFVLCPFLLVPGAVFAGQALLHDAAEANVNQRYVIESVAFAGLDIASLDRSGPKNAVRNLRPGERSPLPPDLRERLHALIGQRCDTEALENLAAEIRKELHLREVTQHLSKGSGPDEVRVNFEVVRKDLGFEVSLPKFLYHSKQGFTGEVDASTRYKQNALLFGVVSNGDDLTERYSGIQARFQSDSVGSAKVRGEVALEDYHEQWNSMTLKALGPGSPEIYRARWNVAPDVSFQVTPEVSVSVGASFQRTQSELPGVPERAANAATLEARGTHQFAGGGFRQQIEGRYSMRLATKAIGSSYVYARHLVSLRYLVRDGRHTVTDELMAGSIMGDAPFFERFVLGSSSTLRGWDRYQIDPLGGSRVVHNEISYSYRIGEGTVEAFYDSGALWQSDRAAQLRHSLGAGYRQGVFVVTLAFPVRNGGVEPVFMAGMNY